MTGQLSPARRAGLALMILGAGLVFGVISALASLAFGGGGSSAFAGTLSPASCSGSAGVDTVTLTGAATATDPDILGVDSTGALYLQAWNPTTKLYSNGYCESGTPAKLTSLTLAWQNSSSGTGDNLVIDESGSGTYTQPMTNCFTITSGSQVAPTSSTTTQVTIKDASNGEIAIGSTSIAFNSSCTATNLPAGISGLDLVGNGTDTLSTGGTANDTKPSTIATTFGLADPAAGNTENIVVGTDKVSTLDFSRVGPGDGCTTASSCTLYINSSPGSQSDLPNGTTPYPINGSIAQDTAQILDGTTYEAWNFSTSATSGTSPAPDVLDYAFPSANYPVDFWGQSGTYPFSSLPPYSSIAALGTGSSTYGISTAPMTAPSSAFYTGPGSDTFYVAGGSDKFFAANVPSSGTDNFYDTGGNNTVDFTGVTTSGSQQLVINASGAPEGIANGSAALGSNPASWQFLDGSGKTTDKNFTTFLGSTNGDTEFIGGDNTGLAFTGKGSGNSAVFDSSEGIVANLDSHLTGASAPSGPFVIAPGNPPVSVSGAVAPGQVWIDGAGFDTLTDVLNVTGPAAGYSYFYAGTGSTVYDFTGEGTTTTGGNNWFYADINSDAAPVSFTSGGENNHILAGDSVETFAETTSTPTPTNTIDFSRVTVPSSSRLVINVSGANSTVPNYGAGIVTGGTESSTEAYSFGTGGSQFNILDGSTSGETTFIGGSGDYQYIGNGAATSNILDFSNVPSGTATALTLDTTPATPTATLGGVPESFSGIDDLIGLANGGTTFVGGSTGGYIFQGNGTGNKAAFTGSATVNLTLQIVSDTGGCHISPNTAVLVAPTATTCLPTQFDSLIDITSIAGQPSGPGFSYYIYAGSSNETFSDSGTNDGNTLDFTYVSTQSNTPLVVDVSGGPSSGTAKVGTTTYTFTSGTSNFTNFIGPTTGYTEYLASPSSNTYHYTATGSGDSIDFSTATSGINVSFVGTDGTVGIGGGTSDIYGITTVTGSSQGGNHFYAGSGPTSYNFTGNGNGNFFTGATSSSSGTDTFTSGGNGNTFIGGQSNEFFNDSGTGNTVDLSPVAPATTVNVTGGSAIGSVANDTAASSQYTYNFTSFGNNPVTFYGSQGGTSFYAGSVADVFEGNSAATNALSFVYVSGLSLTFTVGSQLSCGTDFAKPMISGDPIFGTAQLGSVGESFCGIAYLDGLSGGMTTFVAAASGLAGGYHFVGSGPGNSVDFSGTSSLINANLYTNQVGFAGGPDYLVDISKVIGSTANGNIFTAGTSTNEQFVAAAGSTANKLDFTNVPTSSTGVLVINISGGPVGSLANGSAQAGSYSYSFTGTSGAFTQFAGAANGNTDFLANADTGGFIYYFTAQARTPGNVVDFSNVPYAITIDFTAASPLATWNGTTGQAYLANLTTVIGSSVGGDTFTTGGSSYNLTTTGSGNHFNVGNGPVAITDPGSGNTINFGAVSNLNGQQLSVNVSGGTVGTLPTNEAQFGSTIYTFSNEATNFLASTHNPTVFYAGTVGADSFQGAVGSIGNADASTLDFTNLPSTAGPLTICTALNTGTCLAVGQISLGSVKESFTNITTFNGLTSGSTTFVAGSATGGYVFNGYGSNNTADFSAVTGGLCANLSSNLSACSATLGNFVFSGKGDTVSGVTKVIGSSTSNTYYYAGNQSEVFQDPGSGNHDTVDFSSLITSGSSPLIINLSGTTASGVASDTAQVNGVTYSFSSGAANFTVFYGSGDGNTRFIAARQSGGYTFNGEGSGNTADFSSNPSGIVANFSAPSANFSPASMPGLATNEVYVGGSGAGIDNVNDVQTVIGSPSAENTFYGGLSGIEFVSTSGINMVSYLGSGSTTGVYFDEPTSAVYALGTGGQPNTVAAFDTYSLPGALILQGSPLNDVFRIGTQSTQLQGGGGTDVIDLGSLNGVTVDMNSGSITGTGMAGASWATGCGTNPLCGPANLLSIGTILGSAGNDTYTLSSTALDSGSSALTIQGNQNSTNTLDLSQITQSATVIMPITTGTGKVVGNTAGGPTLVISGIDNLTGTANGGDYVYAGTGTETLTESGATSTLDFSHLPGPTTGSYTGATITVTNSAGVFEGTATTPAQVGLKQVTFTGFNTFVGTNGNDSFTQSGNSPTGGYFFLGGGGANTVNLSGGDTGTTLMLTTPTASSMTDGVNDNCTLSIANNDGQVVVPGAPPTVVDVFSCVGNITSSGATFEVSPSAATATTATILNGGGTGTLELINAPAGQGATINLQTGTVGGAAGYKVTFAGMSTVYGTPYNDTFLDGSGNIAVVGNGGSDSISFAGAPTAAEVNLSGVPYLIPTGYTGAGTDLAGNTATGGYGGVLSLTGISNVIGTTNFNDLLVGPSSGIGSMIGGSGNERFVLSGGFEYITAGSGGSTLDLSLLPGQTGLNLAASGPQYLGGPLAGGVWLLSGNVTQIVASPGGSALLGGVGTLTLQGGSGNDTLVAGSGTQVLNGGGGTDTLIGGVGSDTLNGGPAPVTFQPGSGSDTLTSQTTGNTLSYQGAPDAVAVNLTTSQQTVPPGKGSFSGSTIAPQTASGGWGATVSLGSAGITNLLGTAQSDLIAVGNGDTVTGGGGNDLFLVDGGGNNLIAGNNTDSVFIFEAGGSNIINGGGRATVDYSLGTQGVTVNLQTGTSSGGFAVSSNNQLSGVLNIIGTTYNDVLIAGGRGATIIGNGATNCGSNCGDFLEAGPTGGDLLESNAAGNASGNDTFCAMSSCASPGTTAGGGDTMIGGTGDDTFFAQNSTVDVINGEGGYNYALVDPYDQIANINQLL